MFNNDAFMKQEYSPREEEVSVPELKDFFDKDEKPVITIRGLTANEVAKSNEAQARNRNVSAMVEALTSGSHKEKAEAIKKELGLGDDVHSDIARRKEILVAGSVRPKISEDMAVKMGRVYPTVFYDLSTKILNLTGMGQMPGKPRPSGKEATSK